MWLEELHQNVLETWTTFQRLELPYKCVVVSLIVFTLCSIAGTTALTLLYLVAGFTGVWLGTSVINKKHFVSSSLLKYLPNLIDPQKPGGTKYTFAQDDKQPSGDKREKVPEFSVPSNIQKIIAFIIRDFVLSWYNENISSDESVPERVEDQLYKLAEESSFRLCKSSPVPLLCIILECFRLHVHRYGRAKTSLLRISRKNKKVDTSSLVASYETFELLHPAVQGESTELEYLRRYVEILQQCLFSPQIVKCKPTNVLLNEILSVNVLQALVDLISDPDIVNEIIVLILSDDDLVSSPVSHQGAMSKTESDELGINHKNSRECELGRHDNPPVYSEIVMTDCTTISKPANSNRLNGNKENVSSENKDNSQPSIKHIRDFHISTKNNDSELVPDLGDGNQQEISGNSKSGYEDQQSVNTGRGKSTAVGASAFTITNKITVNKQTDENTGQQNKKQTDISTKAKKDISEVDLMNFIPEVKVHQSAVESTDTSSSYFNKRFGLLGAQQVREDQLEDAIEAFDDVQLIHSKEKRRNIPKKSSRLASKKEHSEKERDTPNPQHIPEERKSEGYRNKSHTASNNFPFPIPFTSIGPSLPILKSSQNKSQSRQSDLKKKQTAEKMKGFSFAPVPNIAIGPSIQFKASSKEIDTDTESEGKLSRSSSSSSFASVTYDEDQQDIPFEEIDDQFAYDITATITEHSKIDGNSKSGNEDIQSVNTGRGKSTAVRDHDASRTSQDKTKDRTDAKKSASKSSLERFNLGSKESVVPSRRVNSLIATDKELNVKSGRDAEKRLSWQGDYSSNEQTIPKQKSHQNISCNDSPHVDKTETQKKTKSEPSGNSGIAVKEVIFTPIAPAPTSANVVGSPKKAKPVLTRSRTTPSMLDIQNVPKQEVAKSEVRLMEAKIGRFHISSIGIPSVEVTRDRSGKDFVLYCIQYNVTAQGTPLRSTSNPDTSQSAVTGVVRKSVKRRHREFVNLQSRLDENMRLRRPLRGVKDPPKRISVGISFTKTLQEQRRISLESYLQQLVRHPLLGHSEEIAEFLALGGDAHIEFVKKRTDIAPKIDEFLQWALPSFVSTVKSAVPRAVAAPLTQALSPPGSPKRKHRSMDFLLGRSEGALSPTPMDNLDIEWVQGHCTINNSTQVQLASHSFLLNQYEKDNIEPKQEKVQKSFQPTKPIIDLGPRFEGDGCDASILAESNQMVAQVLPMKDIELLDKIMALLTEAMHVQGQPSWILDEKLQKGVCILIGKPLDSWIKTQIQSLVSEQWCAYYLTLIQDAIWPDGRLIDSKVVRTQEEKEKMKSDALQCLIHILPGFLCPVIGKDKWQAAMEIMLDSLQDPQLNRHLVFTLLDLLLEAIASEITDHEFQNSLLDATQLPDSKVELF